MMQIRARINFTLHNEKYNKGDEVKINSKEELIRLNERGYIEPLSYAEILEYESAKEQSVEQPIEVATEENKSKEDVTKKKEGKNNE